MDTVKSAFLFPGQGAYVKGTLPQLAEKSVRVIDIFKTIDATCIEAGCALTSEILDASKAPDLDAMIRSTPELLQLILYGTSIATFALLLELKKQPLWLLGHSLGEIAALVCAGAFSIDDGARIIHARNQALRALGKKDGAMIALNINADRAEALVKLLDNPQICVACYNAPRQAVLSGPKPLVDKAQALATALGLESTLIASPYPFHNAMLAPAVVQFAAATRRLPQRPLELPVYSPIYRRFYKDDDALYNLIAGHLVRPVSFADALRNAHSAGVDEFVECGAGAALVGLATRTVPSIQTYAPLSSTKSLETVLATLPSQVSAASPRIQKSGAPWMAGSERLPANHRAAEFAVPTAPQRVREQSPAASEPTKVDRTQVAEAIRKVSAELMGYPPEVFEEDADLEADLGIDSIKRTQIEAAILDYLKLPAGTRGIMAATFGELVTSVSAAQEAQQTTAAVR